MVIINYIIEKYKIYYEKSPRTQHPLTHMKGPVLEYTIRTPAPPHSTLIWNKFSKNQGSSEMVPPVKKFFQGGPLDPPAISYYILPLLDHISLQKFL